MKITLINRQFYFSPLGVGLYFIVLALLCCLGFWQLNRSEQKKQFLEQQQNALQADALDLNQQTVIDVENVMYHRVAMRGRYDQAHQFLIDNQIMDGKSGYFVLTPFLIDKQERAVLINRGWLAAGNDRKVLPNVNLATTTDTITGRINHFPVVGLKLKGAEIPTESWPSVVQLVDTKVLSDKLGYELYDFQIELGADAANGYRREWKINTAIPPEKHIAYAVQWFGLALALTCLFVWISIKE